MPNTTDTTLFSITFTDPDNLKAELSERIAEVEQAWQAFQPVVAKAYQVMASADRHVSDWADNLPVDDGDSKLFLLAETAIGLEHARQVFEAIHEATHPDRAGDDLPDYQAWRTGRRETALLGMLRDRWLRYGDEAREWGRAQGFSEDLIVKTIGPSPV
jgi:hypothetical protein